MSPDRVLLTYTSATVSLYQGLILPPLEGTPGTWRHAVRRCVAACDNMTNLLQSITDTDLENMSPLLIPCIFVAARFCIRKSEAADACGRTMTNESRSPRENIRHRTLAQSCVLPHQARDLWTALAICAATFESFTNGGRKL
jgi:hypothetical protein